MMEGIGTALNRVRRKRNVFGIVVLVVLLAALTGCGGGQDESDNNAIPPSALSSGFSSYQEVPVDVTPAVEPYTVAPDLSNLLYPDMFYLSDEAKQLLVKNGFVVVPNKWMDEFFPLYEQNRYSPVPLFVTTDSMLHNYHLFFDHLLRSMETNHFSGQLQALNQTMLAQAQQQYDSLSGTPWENAAKRNLAFFAVGSKLMDSGVEVPSPVKDIVDQELALIDKHDGIHISPVMNLGETQDPIESLKEDYTQYIPRGHYDRSDVLRAYFKSMMWYGRLTFRLKSQDETRSAVLATLALDANDNLDAWNSIYEPTRFLVGNSDDITYYQFQDLLNQVYGGTVDLKTLTSDQEKWNAFIAAAAELQPPSINSMFIFDETIQPDRTKEIMGFRFMGQRFTLDASVFQRLVYREVGENDQGQRRMLPKGLDVAAAMGSTEAYSLLDSMGETKYDKYPENMAKMKEKIAGLDAQTWTQNIYWGWLYSLLPLTEEKPAGYPSFMLNQAWTRKSLNTYLGSWTELKHDTILYAKQVYAEAGGGPEEEIDDRGYVEPDPYVYARLAALVQMTRTGLDERGLLDQEDADELTKLEQLSLSLLTISEKELSNTTLTDEEYDLIRSYGVQLEHFWLEALKDEGITDTSGLTQEPSALVADVATDPNGSVLEEATGAVHQIYAVVPVDGKLKIAVGGVYSYYEFPWPINDRLTDKKWQQMLADDQAPPQPSWTSIYTAPAPQY